METVAKCPRGCVHQGRWDAGTMCCFYILDTGRRRPCPAGPDCTEYKKGKHPKKLPEHWED